jgi:hypothetical protein
MKAIKALSLSVMMLLLTVIASGSEVTFKSKPTFKKDGGKSVIAFEVSGTTDVEVTILDAKDKIVRHLAAGVLGAKNPPPPPLKTGLKQKLTWDGKTDTATKATAGPFKVQVRLGLGVALDGFIGEQKSHIAFARGLATDADGNLYLYSASTGNKVPGGTPYLLKYSRQGEYIKTLMPMPADLEVNKARQLGLIQIPGEKHLHPKSLFGTWPVLGFMPGNLYNQVDSKGNLTFFDWKQIHRLAADGGPCADGFAIKVWKKTPDRAQWRYKLIHDGCIALDPKGQYVYMGGLRDKKAAAGNPAGRVYRMKLNGGQRQKFVDIEGATATGNMSFDADGNLLVCTPEKVVVFNTEAKKIGEITCPNPFQLACDNKTGAIYVLTKAKRRGNWNAAKSLLKFDNWKSGKQLLKLNLGSRGPQAFMALDAGGDKPTLWVLISRTGGASPFNPGTTPKLLRIEDAGSKFVDTDHKIKYKRDPFGVITRLAVHPLNDRIVCRSEFSLAASYDGLSGKRLKAPFKHAPDMAVGLDGNWYITPGNVWMGPICKYDPDLKPIPTPGASTSGGKTKANKVGFAFGRYGAGFGVAGLAADAKGRIYTLQQFNKHTVAGDIAVIFGADGRAEDHGRMKGDPRITKKHKQFESGIFGPIETVVGNIAVDWQGNIYMALRTLPKVHVPPPGYQKDPAYWHCTGTIVKVGPKGGSLFNLGGKGSRPYVKVRKVPSGMKGMYMANRFRYPCGPQFCEGALIAYPGIGVMGGGFGTGCRCRQPMFELDGWGRLFVPNATTYSVRILDNTGNEILEFGNYGNADSRGKTEKSPISTPEIPLGWPEAVGASNKAVYVADVLNRRIVRLMKTYQAEETIPLK